jgi:hypothetical protein
VTLPPGRARLAIKPAPTGSTDVAITMGMVVVVFFAANDVGPPWVTIRSTFRRTRSAASSGSRSSFCSANRYSMVILSFNPSKLAQLLPKRVQEDRDTRSSAIIQVTYAKEFSRLLRGGGEAKSQEHSRCGETKSFLVLRSSNRKSKI